MFRAQPTIDPVDMRQNVSYFSAKPNARSVQALLDGDENGFRLADPLADGERLRAIFRTIDDVSAQDGRMRSEEHTSELQSLMRISYAVFCLKKKKQKSTQIQLAGRYKH